MKRSGAMRIAIALAAALFCGAARAAEVFVSPTGRDANAGTAERPFATLQRARDAVRGKRGPTTIHLAEGVYYLPETLVLRAQDSGAADAPVTYQAAPGGRVVLSGGSKLDLKWAPYRDGILQAPVPADFHIDQLFVNGELQPLARYPNYDAHAQYFNGAAADVLSPQRVARWADPRGGFLHALHAGHWGGFHYRITGKSADNKVTYEGGWQNNRRSGMNEGIRFVENIFEELDAPREWFHDAKRHVLYYYPPAGLDVAAATVESTRLHHLLELQGDSRHPVRFVRFKGITFRHAVRTFMEPYEPLLRSDWTIYRGGAILFAGSEDCSLEGCMLDRLGGNAVFVSNYNRRVTVRGCQIVGAGGNGVAFVGDPKAVRNPLFEYGEHNNLKDIDRTPGPQTDNYPADCLVDDCLIHNGGRIDKQSAGVQISMSRGITVRHCSIYDVPRAGINIGDGCWGGHVIEFCDVFDTVKETGDHGAFNSWGRDRYWNLSGSDPNNLATPEERELPLLDAITPTILRNNRWRCDHGWDIDLDDGSSNYEIRDNLCLHGGLKNREGFYRVVENNIIVDNSFHPHVWFKGSGDIFRRNIVFTDYKPIGVPQPWGQEVDYNLLHGPGMPSPLPATALQSQSGRDEHSLRGDALFVDPEKGDYRVQEGSPALALGFTNFPMDQFGVQDPRLRSIASQPRLPGGPPAQLAPTGSPRSEAKVAWLGATIKNLNGLGELSAAGMSRESGVRVVEVPPQSRAALAGLKANDVILKCGGKPTETVADLFNLCDELAGRGKTQFAVWRNQASQPLEMELTSADRRGPLSQALLSQPSPDVTVVCESRADRAFARLPPVGDGARGADLTAGKFVATEPATDNERPATLMDGQIADNYGPVFPNGVATGKYKLDLGKAVAIGRVNTYSFNQNNSRGQQRFTLYGAEAPGDPGWNVEDANRFRVIARVDTTAAVAGRYVATSIGAAMGDLGRFRWLIWASQPVSGVENTAFQEFVVLPAAGK